MQTSTRRRQAQRNGRFSARAIIALVAIAGVSGCDSLLEVSVPGQVTVDALDNPGVAPILVSGAIADFECAFANYVGRTGLLTDEFITSAGWRNINIVAGRLQDASGGSCPTGSASSDTPAWGPLQRARFQAQDAYQRITAFTAEEVENREQLLATTAAFAGHSLTLLGEGYCRGVIDGGSALSREDLWELAEAEFTTALQHAQAANATEVANLARTGRARVRLNLEKWAEALADAEQVPEHFVYDATYSTVDGRRHNVVHRLNRPNNFISVHPSFRGLTVNGVPDNRVVVEDGQRFGHDGVTPMFYAQKYPSLSSPIPMATWREAQTIVAEVRARQGDGAAAVQAINRLRDTAELPLFSSSDSDEIFQQVIEERRRELFAQGRRSHELLRLGLPWEEGATHKGEPYGHVKCMELPDDEVFNNPNL